MVLTDNLVGYYALDGDVTDSTGNQDGTNNGASGSATGGLIGGRYVFDGVNDYIDSNWNNAQNDNKGGFSVSLWIKSSTSKSGGEEYVFGCISETGSPDAAFGIKISTSDYASMIVHGTGGSPNHEFDNVNIIDGSWHHLVGVLTGTNVEFWVDGTRKVNAAYTFIGNVILEYDSFIGSTNNRNGGPYTNFAGEIDEVGIWTRQLSSDEIAELYNGGSGLAYPFTGGPSGSLDNSVFFGGNF